MFTNSCFIRKSSSDIIDKLESYGYNIIGDKNNPYILTSSIGEYAKLINFEYVDMKSINGFMSEYGVIDCKDNENLFLAITALRDDSDEDQWFVYPETDFWFICYNNNINEERNSPSVRCSCQAAWFYDSHKASVEELIKHFEW